MNAEQTERLLRRASALIEVDMELKASLRKVILDQQKMEDKTEVLGTLVMHRIESLFKKPQWRLRLSAVHWF